MVWEGERDSKTFQSEKRFMQNVTQIVYYNYGLLFLGGQPLQIFRRYLKNTATFWHEICTG